jgi:hypothetical protein
VVKKDYVMLKKLLLLTAMIYGEKIFSQSVWDIDYINEDSISKRQIGKEIQIDFKSKQNIGEGKPFRYSLPRKDTGELVINDEKVVMVEVRKIYPDWGLYSEQYLESLNDIKPNIKLRIRNSFLKEVNRDSILITVNVELHKIKKRKSDIIESKTYDIWVERVLLSGLICRKI